VYCIQESEGNHAGTYLDKSKQHRRVCDVDDAPNASDGMFIFDRSTSQCAHCASVRARCGGGDDGGCMFQ